MNLLDSDNVSAQKKYVVDMMRTTKLEDVSVGTKKKKISLNKNVLLYMMFGFLIMCGSVALSSDKFIVSADKLNLANDGQVLGETTSLSVNALTPKTKKSAVPSYIKGDTRVLALKKFLESQGSVVSQYADVFVSAADKEGLDYRLVVSIAGVESGFCKATTIRLDSNLPTYNCWGWGKNGKKFAEFNSWQESITAVTKGIAKGYGKNATPESMQFNYCHSCRGASTWQTGVKDYMSRITQFESKIVKEK